MRAYGDGFRVWLLVETKIAQPLLWSGFCKASVELRFYGLAFWDLLLPFLFSGNEVLDLLGREALVREVVEHVNGLVWLSGHVVSCGTTEVLASLV